MLVPIGCWCDTVPWCPYLPWAICCTLQKPNKQTKFYLFLWSHSNISLTCDVFGSNCTVKTALKSAFNLKKLAGVFTSIVKNWFTHIKPMTIYQYWTVFFCLFVFVFCLPVIFLAIDSFIHMTVIFYCYFNHNMKPTICALQICEMSYYLEDIVRREVSRLL